ncbi:unnamed protein product, partial [Discosporangium mesarthrocarpum]
MEEWPIGEEKNVRVVEVPCSSCGIGTPSGPPCSSCGSSACVDCVLRCKACSREICDCVRHHVCTDEDCQASYCAKCAKSMEECSGCTMTFCPVGRREGEVETPDDECDDP